MTPKPIPEGTKTLNLELWQCGDDCRCRYFEVISDGQDLRRKSYLWEGMWFWDDEDPENIQEAKKEAAEVVVFYGMTVDTSLPYWEIEAERVIG